MRRPKQWVPRRTFLKTAGATAGAAVGFPYIVDSKVLAAPGRTGANERLNVAFVGVGGRGGGLLRSIKRHDVNIVAVCDVDENRLRRALQAKMAGPKAEPYRDYRYVLDRKDVDAIVFATPDHWHAVNTVHACEAGKHVYVEKPAHCTIEEGKAMVAAAKKAKVAVQVGSQGRSQAGAHAAKTYIQNGQIGTVKEINCWHYASPTGGFARDSAPPPELDWDLWLGPLRWRPYNKAYLHRTFRWFMESGGGQIRDRGAHVMSCALYCINADDTGPVTVEATGTAPTKGLWNTAVDMEVTYTFTNPYWVLRWLQPGSPVPRENGKPSRYGATYHGTGGKLVIWGGDGGTWTEAKAHAYTQSGKGEPVYKSPGHYEDWFNGIKTGAKTIMNIDAGVAVANLCVLGNLSFLLGRKLQWDQAKQEIVGDEEARRLMGRPQRHPYHL